MPVIQVVSCCTSPGRVAEVVGPMSNPLDRNENATAPSIVVPGALTRWTILLGCFAPFYAVGGLTFAAWWNAGGRILPLVVVAPAVLVSAVWLTWKTWAVRIETRPGSVRVVNLFSDHLLEQANVADVDVAGCKRWWLQFGKHPALRLIMTDGSSVFADATLYIKTGRLDAVLLKVRSELGLSSTESGESPTLRST